MKTRELSLRENQAILKLGKEGKSIRAIAQALEIACTTTWNVLKKKENRLVYWATDIETGRPRITTAVDDRNNCENCEEKPQNISQWHHKQSPQGREWRYLNQPFEEDLESSKYRGYTTTWCKPLISSKNWKARLQFAKKYRDDQKSSGTKFYGLMRPRLTSTKVMERPKCGERRDLLTSKTYKLICEAQWRKCHGLGLHGCFWSGLTNLY